MDQRNAFLIQILEHIGSPLMRAIIESRPASLHDDTKQARDDAGEMARLLGKTVQLSIDLANMTDMASAGLQDDSLRLALTALSGPLVAAKFKEQGKPPEDQALKQITVALQAVLTFSENFSLTQDSIDRLKSIKPNSKALDSYQVQLQYLSAMTPVIEAVSQFTFGLAEQKLVNDIGQKLSGKALEMRESLLASITDEASQKLAEISLLSMMAEQYAACHQAETRRLSQSANESANSSAGIDKVWQAFETRLTLLETLARSMLSESSSDAGGVSAGASAQKTSGQESLSADEAAPAEKLQKPPQEDEPAQTSQQTDQAPKDNPMGFFAKPKETKVDSQSDTPPPSTPQETAHSETPPPIETDQQPEKDNNEKPAASDNPMAFFKPGKKKDNKE